MDNKFFKKSLLAMVVSASTVQAFASEYDLSQGFKDWTGQTLNETLTLTGQRTRQSNTDNKGVTFFQNTVAGSIINQGDFTFDAQGARVSGIGLDAGLMSNTSAGSHLQGDFINAGHIILNNVSGAQGIEVGNATITGNFVNAGTVSITQVAGPSIFSSEGIYLHGTTLGGDLLNSGLIDVTGNEVTGLILDSHFGHPVNIAGKILNTGTIRVTGEESIGFDVETNTSDLRIENSGSILSNGKNSEAIILQAGSVDSLRNSGTIQATGDNAVAIKLDGTTFTQNAASGARGIINTGSIVAQGVAIQVGGDQVSAFEINQQAGVIRSTQAAAIDGAGLAKLNWTGGAIEGDLLNLDGTNIAGQANYTGKKIGSTVSVTSGSLNLQNQGVVITGDLNVGANSGIDMLLSDRVTPGTPYLTVDGKATFAQSSKVTLNAKPGDFTPTAAGTQYTLVKASSLQNNGLSVTSSSSLLNVASYTTDAQTVNALVTLKSDSQVDEEQGNIGTSRSTRQILNRFKNGPLGQLNSNDAVFKAFANASSQEELAKLGEQLAPEVSRGAVNAAVSGQAMMNGAISNRVSGLRSGLSSGDSLADTGVWVQGLSSNQDQDSRDAVAGYSANSSGIAVGADGKLNANSTVGLAYSYLNTNVTSDTGNKTDVQGQALTLYGSWDLRNWFVDGSLSYGRNDNDSKRYIADSAAKASYNSDAWALSALSGYTFKLTDQLIVEPRVAARYTNIQLDSFNEHGSSAALHSNAQRFEIGELGAGLRMAADVPLLNGTLTPEASVMAYHDFIGDQINQTSSFILGGSPFIVAGASPVRNSYEGRIGVKYQIDALTLGTNYGYQTKTGFNADTFTVEARYAF
ncbi:outer membrane autotransporter barrel domain-containing protein [Pseudomonas sp. GM18]|uniref:autotransporter family protein n=1 Tax=Pseudomonas sp. GM18 TaxID=1144324 RepID=UPI0002725511|nr:autotransporter outer membrane beta-barrel domain-containing protein [Pseudomonas sp. GM18]EJM15608.1 outer membrane autotransporter barrel domain-containing protein [Pseudomonas sp. GM18]